MRDLKTSVIPDAIRDEKSVKVMPPSIRPDLDVGIIIPIRPFRILRLSDWITGPVSAKPSPWQASQNDETPGPGCPGPGACRFASG
jgi:hypothetical protein